MGIVGSVIAAFYYLRIIKTMYIDDPAPKFEGRPGLVESGLVFVSAAAISPLGMLGLAWLGSWTLLAARSLF